MKLRQWFCVALFGLSLAMPMGCGPGDPGEATPENDPLMQEGADDPTLSGEETEVAP